MFGLSKTFLLSVVFLSGCAGKKSTYVSEVTPPASSGGVIPPTVVTGSYLRGILFEHDGQPVENAKVKISSNGYQFETESDGRFKVPIEKIDMVVLPLQINTGPRVVVTDLGLPADLIVSVSAGRVKEGLPVPVGAVLPIAGSKPAEVADDGLSSRTLGIQLPANRAPADVKQPSLAYSIPVQTAALPKSVGTFNKAGILITNANVRLNWDNMFSDAAQVKIVFARSAEELSGWDGRTETIPAWPDSPEGSHVVSDYSKCSEAQFRSFETGALTALNDAKCGLLRDTFPFNTAADVFVRMVGESSSELRLSAVFKVSPVEASKPPLAVGTVPAQTVAENAPPLELAVVVNEAGNNVACGSVLTAQSSNQTLLPTQNINVSGIAPDCKITLSLAQSKNGTSEISLVADNGVMSASSAFVLTVSGTQPAEPRPQPVLTLINAAVDELISAAEKSLQTAIVQLSGGPFSSEGFAIVSESTNCDAALIYTAALPTAARAAADKTRKKICARSEDSEGNIAFAQTATVSIENFNSAPVLAIAGDVAKTTVENTPVAIQLSTATDPDVATDSQTLSYLVLSGPARGQLGTLPVSAMTGGTMTYSPNAGFAGSDVFSYSICDNAPTPLCTAALTVTVTVNATAPLLSYAGSTGTTGTFGVPMSVTPTVLNGRGSSITNCTISPALPAGLAIHSATCDISGTPTATSTATTYAVTATNSVGQVTASVDLVVAAGVPVLSYAGSAGTTGVVGSAMSVAPTTLSARGSPITNCVSSAALPEGLTLNSSTCVISGTPVAGHSAISYTIAATNAAGSAEATVSLSVLYFPAAYAVGARSGLDSQVALTWISPSAIGQTVTAFKIHRDTAEGFTPAATNLIATVTAPTTTFTDVNVANGTRYFYKVVTVYGSSEAEPSSPAPALPLDPTSTTQDLNHLFVSPTGDDITGNGSIGSPYKTINKALTMLNAGGTVYLQDGFYTTFASFSKSMTLQSMTGDYRTSAAVISASGSLDVGSQIQFSIGVDNLTFRGIETVNTRIQSLGVAPRSGLHFFNNYFQNTKGHSWIHAGTGFFLSNVTFHGNYFRNMGARETDQATIVNYWPDKHDNANWLISRNTIEQTAWAAFQLSGVSGLSITHNTFYSTCDNAIRLWINKAAPTGQTEISYNVFGGSFKDRGHPDCEASGILFKNVDMYTPEWRIKVHNNFFMRNASAIKIDDNCNFANTSISILNNSFDTSNSIAISVNCSAGTLDMRNNYWGHPSGPTHSSNSGGLGGALNIVSGSVNYVPFLGTEPTPSQEVIRAQNEVGGSGGPLSTVLSGPFALFQNSLNENLPNRGLAAPSDESAFEPYGLGAYYDSRDGGKKKFFAVDRKNKRVLIFHSIPTSSSSRPDVVVGQNNFVSNGANAGFAGTNEFGYSDPVHVTVCESGTMFVADKLNHRILGYHRVPKSNGAAADFVIGQTSLNSSAPGTSATTLNEPFSAFCRDDKLFVVDRGNHRIVVYSPIPTSNTPVGSYVIGQPDLVTGTSGCAANKFKVPYDVLFFDDKIVVSDGSNNRVLVFPNTGQSNPSSETVLGQSDFTSCGPAVSPPTASSMSGPNGLAFNRKNILAVADQFNHRVLLFELPFSNGKNAFAQIGQDNFTSNTLYVAPDISNRLNFPKRILFDNGFLWITDTLNHRIITLPLGQN